ncbi:MAG: NYN domain-containing protein [Candidatus Parcubacteria bacterium]|nr:MAG: NYN domain-containing protein [Candidatus Parcubacteria bacterium]
MSYSQLKEYKTMKPKTKVYIDGANMFYTQKKLGWFIDWRKMKDFLKERWDILELRYYTGMKMGDEKMASFLRYLDRNGITSITKPVKVIKIPENHFLRKLYSYSEIYKSNCDVEITTDILLERAEIDEIVLFSGDSDFRYLIAKLKNLGKKVIVFSSRKTISWELKVEASKYFYLEDIKDKICRK